MSHPTKSSTLNYRDIEGRACDYVSSMAWFGIILFASTRPTVNASASCVLAEMCAGEPVFAGPSLSSSEGPSGVGGKSNWLEAAAELPPALRRTIRALTHPNSDKVGATYWRQHASSS